MSETSTESSPQTPGQASPHNPLLTSDRLPWLLVAAWGAFLLFYGLGSYRTLTRHEGFVAVVSSEMLQTGDWVVPRFGGLPRLKKPPLAYWTAAASSWTFGTSSEWTVRLPSAIAALLLAGLTGYWAKCWYGNTAGWVTALVQVSSLICIDFGRKSEVDFQLCLLTTTALFLIANYHPGELRSTTRWRWAGVLTLIGLAWLAKFHYGPVMILSVCGVWFAWNRWWSAFLNWLNPVGLVALILAVVVWPCLVLRQIPDAWEVWRAETIGRASGELGTQPVWYYLPQVAIQMFPWSLMLPVALRQSIARARQGDSREAFLWIWFSVQFVILTASAFKHHHYLLAALPCVALTLGRAWAGWLEKLPSRPVTIPRTWLAAGGVLGVLATAGIALAVSVRWPALQVPAALAMTFLTAGLFAGALFYNFRLQKPALLTAACGTGLCYAIVMSWIFPGRDPRQPDVEFAAAVRQLQPQDQVCVFHLEEHPVVYYLHAPLARMEALPQLRERLQADSRLLVVTSASQAASLSELGECRTLLQADQDEIAARFTEQLLLCEVSRPLALTARDTGKHQ